MQNIKKPYRSARKMRQPNIKQAKYCAALQKSIEMDIKGKIGDQFYWK